MAIEKTYLDGSGVQLGTSHFDLQSPKPLDARARVPKYEGLTALSNGNAAYAGMLVYVEDEKKYYSYDGASWTELKTSANANIIISQEEPTGGSVGDVWFKY